MNAHPVYLIACALIGLAGRRRRAGFVGFTVIALLVTPLVALIILFATAPKPEVREQDE
ncbi:MAG: hypothetical protein IPK80_34185 [Nannocystis sp.]|nr:hypothetical protein [Nannocystis sp.]